MSDFVDEQIAKSQEQIVITRGMLENLIDAAEWAYGEASGSTAGWYGEVAKEARKLREQPAQQPAQQPPSREQIAEWRVRLFDRQYEMDADRRAELAALLALIQNGADR